MNNNDIFDNFIEKKEEVKVDQKTGVVEEVTQPKPQAQHSTNNQQAPALKKDISLAMAEKMLVKIEDLTKQTGESFNEKEKIIAMDIMVASVQSIRQSKYQINQIDFIGNNIENQVKRWSKLGVGKEDYLYTELRQNGKTGMVDIRIKPQYQTLEKLIIKYCTKKIFKFKTEVICEDDEFETDFDFATGQDKVVKHVKSPKRNPNDLANIVGAYKVAFVKENDGSITQLLTQIDKNRIMRAYNSAQTKNVWNSDTQKMVLKTVTWEMWNSADIRPFMQFPDDIIKNDNIGIVNESADVEFVNKDLKHKDIIDAKSEVVEKVGTGEEIDF